MGRLLVRALVLVQEQQGRLRRRPQCWLNWAQRLLVPGLERVKVCEWVQVQEQMRMPLEHLACPLQESWRVSCWTSFAQAWQPGLRGSRSQTAGLGQARGRPRTSV
jgi:hypothetical protein